MCGIAGRASRAPIAEGEAREIAAGMERALRRRGPDGGRVHHDADVLLVHRRLSIIDLSDAGAQPLWNEDGTICVIVNGEIYNFQALRRALEGRGHRFRSGSDSEVLVHLYEDRGINETCAALEGMFAFALFDARSRDVYLVRDRLGIKPLVIAEHAEGVTFGSSLQAVLADPAVPRDLRAAALPALVKWGFIPSPWSAVRAARRVAPGSWLRVRAGRLVEERRWWTDDVVAPELSDALVRAAVAEAVRTHLVADVPVGGLLSAGVDSGLVVGLAAAERARQAGDAGALEVWTVSHRGCEEDELADAARAAAHFGVSQHEIPVGRGGLTPEAFDAVVGGMDEPLAVSSLVGLHSMFRAIAPECRVVLSGDGGDELFAGYDWHVGMPRFPEWASRGWFRAATPWLSRFAGFDGRLGAVGSVATHARRHPASRYLDKLRIAQRGELEALGLPGEHDGAIEALAVEAWERFAPSGVLEQMLAVDRATSLVDEMLAKLDTASMAYSVEARVPLLGDGVLEAAKGLTAEWKRDGESGKIALRRWYAEVGPNGLAARRKTGFNSPLRSWLDGPAAHWVRDWAARGRELLGAANVATAPRVTFALAVLGAWQARLAEPTNVRAS